ncbi:MAG TPA: AAA family ATPase [Candidatus Hydrogenedentes bacterium]|nr:AAA family ATPase [Candidatus Hydrogenedentota bacterium]HQH54371.1 AAA family ATPase [Candidatus Hydrogenedentota bacterium]
MFKLSAVTNDLAMAAEQNRLEPGYEMEKEVFRIRQFLSRKDRKNVLIVGEHGVGKTKLAQGVAIAGVKGAAEEGSRQCRVLELNLPALLAIPKEQCQDAMASLVKFLKANPERVLFIDDISPLFSAQDDASVRNVLGSAVRTGEIPCLGTLTTEEYGKLAAANALAGAHLELLRLEPASEEKTTAILEKIRPALERHHTVQIGDEALEDAIRMTQQYMPKQHLPGKAIEVLDQACARYKLKIISRDQCADLVDSGSLRHLGIKVGSHDVKRVVMEITAIDIDVDQAEAWRKQLEQRMKRHVVGQDDAVEQIATVMTKVRMSFGKPGRPAGVMLLAGPTGMGKMHAVRCLTYQLLGSGEDLTVFNLANFTAPEDFQRLFGIAPTHEGNAAKGLLAKARNAPFAIIAFEGIEHAPQAFFETLAPILASGVMKDLNGGEIGFKNCLLVLTLNMPSATGGTLTKESVAQYVSKEILDCCSAIIAFRGIELPEVRTIIRKGLEELYRTLKPRGIGLRVHDGVYDLVASRAYDPDNGMAGLPEVLEGLVARPVSNLVESGNVPSGGTIEVTEKGGTVLVRVAE